MTRSPGVVLDFDVPLAMRQLMQQRVAFLLHPSSLSKRTIDQLLQNAYLQGMLDTVEVMHGLGAELPGKTDAAG